MSNIRRQINSIFVGKGIYVVILNIAIGTICVGMYAIEIQCCLKKKTANFHIVH